MVTFGEYLRLLREKSPYPTITEFSRHCELDREPCRKWESGEWIPKRQTVETILSRMPYTEEEKAKVWLLWHRTKAASLGVDLNAEAPSLNVSEVAATIQREVEHELRRVGGIELTPRTRRVCTARIELILKNALGKT